MNRDSAIRQHYRLRATPTFASSTDPRLSYCLYVPPAYADSSRADCRLLIAVHGTDRGHQRLRDLFAEFAEHHNCIVLAPLFPAGIGDTEDLDNYKYIRYRDLKFDDALLAMVAEVETRYRLPRRRLLMFGFSGGAHFAHRFGYIHPERLAALSIAAPGSVTLPDESIPWWVGLGGFEDLFGHTPDIESFREVPMQLLVGANDTNTFEITHAPGSAHWMDGANVAGRTRIERLRTLHTALARLGTRAALETIDGVGHQVEPLTRAAQPFLAQTLERVRKQAVTV